VQAVMEAPSRKAREGAHPQLLGIEVQNQELHLPVEMAGERWRTRRCTI